MSAIRSPTNTSLGLATAGVQGSELNTRRRLPLRVYWRGVNSRQKAEHAAQISQTRSSALFCRLTGRSQLRSVGRLISNSIKAYQRAFLISALHLRCPESALASTAQEGHASSEKIGVDHSSSWKKTSATAPLEPIPSGDSPFQTGRTSRCPIFRLKRQSRNSWLTSFSDV